jgi:hypothetical protein
MNFFLIIRTRSMFQERESVSHAFIILVVGVDPGGET